MVPNVPPLKRDDLPSLEPQLQLIEEAMGFLPASLLTMARRPDLLQAFLGFAVAVQRAPGLEPELVQLVAHVASTAAGCRYCQAHTGAQAARRGAAAEKVAAAWEFEQSPSFSERERAALRLARDAALVPNATTPQHFTVLHEHFSEEEIVSLVAVIGLFGFLNRWNDTLATELEEEPLEFAEQQLGGRGWRVGKHARKAESR